MVANEKNFISKKLSTDLSQIRDSYDTSGVLNSEGGYGRMQSTSLMGNVN